MKELSCSRISVGKRLIENTLTLFSSEDILCQESELERTNLRKKCAIIFHVVALQSKLRSPTVGRKGHLVKVDLTPVHGTAHRPLSTVLNDSRPDREVAIIYGEVSVNYGGTRSDCSQ